MNTIDDAKVIEETHDKTTDDAREVAVPNLKQVDTVLLTESYVRLVERQLELRSKLLMTAIKATKKHDWIDFGGKPYMEGEGGWRIMSTIRGFKIGETIFSGDKEMVNNHYFIEAATEVEWMGQATVGLGDCSTIDVFFTGKEGDSGLLEKETKRTGNAQIAARLILGNAKKKARENSISRAVTELLGLKGLTWDDLAQLGYDASEAGARVDFKKGSQGAQTITYTVRQALLAPVGSVFDLRGQIANIIERTPKEKTITDYYLTELTSDATIKVSTWGSATKGAAKGAWLFCEGVTVRDYQGKPQYSAKSVSIVENETPILEVPLVKDGAQ